ncbi:hypothetical protein SAMN04489864_10675 [Pedobacter insulae]|uniref:Uncharacterized protein n=2 Tax=Pedobacter insulae TaxID=414048 RepID=A0A1I2XVW5_9SPHI|nr:hypothetical protein SAMN04489864_10675 [Pedobacter insulae]
MEWENEAPILAALPRVTPYRVPDNYFNELTAHLNSAAFLDGLTQGERNGFTVPTNYFEELNDQISSRIALEQFKSITSSEGFSTPSNYFDKLQANILSQTIDVKPKTKTVRLWQSDLVRYAAAACLIILTASGLYFNQQRTVKKGQSTVLASEAVLYDIDESVIIEHLKESQQATNSTASQAEMESYILNHYSSNDLSNNL